MFASSDQGLSSARSYSDCVACNLPAKTDKGPGICLTNANLPPLLSLAYELSKNGHVQVSHEGNKLSTISVSQFQSCLLFLEALQGYISSSPVLVSWRRHV